MPKVLLFFISLCRFNPTYHLGNHQNFPLKIEKSQVSSKCESRFGKTALLAAALHFPDLREDGSCLTVLKPPPCTSPAPHVGCYISVKSHENMLLQPFYCIYHILLFSHPMVIFLCHLMIKHYFNYHNYKHIYSMSNVKERKPKDFSVSNKKRAIFRQNKFHKDHYIYMSMCVLRCFHHVQLSGTLWTAVHQSPLSMGFFRQEYWSGLPCPPPGGLPDLGTEPASRIISCIDRWVLYQ